MRVSPGVKAQGIAQAVNLIALIAGTGACTKKQWKIKNIIICSGTLEYSSGF